MRPHWIVLVPFLIVVAFAALAVGKVWDRAACDGFSVSRAAWQNASTSSRLGERSAKWRIAEKLDVCGTLDGLGRRGVVARLGAPGSDLGGALRWQVGDNGVLTVRLRHGRVAGVTGPS